MSLVTDLLSNVDRAGNTYVANAYGALAQSLTEGGPVSVGSLMLTLYVIFWGSASGREPRAGAQRSRIPLFRPS